MMENVIDIVIPWVDGNDFEWQMDKEKYDASSDGDKRVNRYRDWDNLEYWFRGVEKFLPWVRKIHFVTYGHLPKWLNTDNPRLNIVKHSDYIPEKYLPIFNSHPIEMNFHRIEGLSEQFIYANDDMFFIRPMKSEDFFQNGYPKDCAIESVLQFKKGGIDHIIANNLEVLNANFNKREVLKREWKNWYNIKYGKNVEESLFCSMW